MNEQLAFIFPGQGSQSVGMLAELAAEFAIVEETYEQAASELGYDLWQLVQQCPEEKLNQTEYTQPALLAAEIAMWRIWAQKQGTKPLFLSGHSLGEYSALVGAKAINFQDAIKLVTMRGKLMQQVVSKRPGGMVAIAGLDNEKVATVCKEAAHNQILAPANYNSIGQTVLSGDLDAALRAIDIAKQQGAKIAKLLKVSVPAHCELMKPAAEKLAKYLENIDMQKPVIPVINNVDVAIYKNADDIRDGLVRQLYNPVRWVEIIQFLYAKGINCLVECGPGKILAGLNKRIVRDLPTIKFTELLRR
jgi:[acyl-carrier-protein] S-malonyltransferase